MGQVFDFIANSADGVFAVDCWQRIVLWNNGATEILGYRPDDVLGRECYRVLRGVDADGCGMCHNDCEVMELARRLEFPAACDVRIRHKCNEAVWVNLSTVVIPAGNHELTAVVHMFRDVTEQHEMLRVVLDFAGIVSGMANRIVARRTKPIAAAGTGNAALTRREREILGCLATGISTDEIARQLGISRRTVRNHVSNLLGKLGVHSRLEAVTHAMNIGLF